MCFFSFLCFLFKKEIKTIVSLGLSDFSMCFDFPADGIYHLGWRVKKSEKPGKPKETQIFNSFFIKNTKNLKKDIAFGNFFMNTYRKPEKT